jgi:hypothetical protein
MHEEVQKVVLTPSDISEILSGGAGSIDVK